MWWRDSADGYAHQPTANPITHTGRANAHTNTNGPTARILSARTQR